MARIFTIFVGILACALVGGAVPALGADTSRGRASAADYLSLFSSGTSPSWGSSINRHVSRLLVPAPLSVVPPDFLRSQLHAASRPHLDDLPDPENSPDFSGGRRFMVDALYAVGYATATRVGTRLGIESDFRVVRLESAYMYDLIGHVFAVKNIGHVLTSTNRWAGYDMKESRRRGAWWGAFGMWTYMEALNGFMPTVRLDPLDVPANALGAYLADGGQEVAENNTWLRRVSLQLGYKDINRVLGDESSMPLGNLWHDYPNGRWGLGVDVGPADAHFFTLFATYSITSTHVATMQNRFGMGLELNVIGWFTPLIEKIPAGSDAMVFYRWVNERFMLPGFYVQLFHFDTGAWSNRDPFGR